MGSNGRAVFPTGMPPGDSFGPTKSVGLGSVYSGPVIGQAAAPFEIDQRGKCAHNVTTRLARLGFEIDMSCWAQKSDVLHTALLFIRLRQVEKDSGMREL